MTELPAARITNTQVFIGGIELPGLISAGGVSVKPGGRDDFNTMTVEFIVGEVIVEEGAL